MTKASISPSICTEAVQRVLWKTDQPEMDSFLEERNPEQKWPEIETYKFAQEVFVYKAMK